jgi:hypothetical protein
VVASLESTRGRHFWYRPPDPEWEQEVVSAAQRAGSVLVQFETDTGQVVWSWSRPGEGGPQFLTRRVALAWMADVLERDDHHAL